MDDKMRRALDAYDTGRSFGMGAVPALGGAAALLARLTGSTLGLAKDRIRVQLYQRATADVPDYLRA